MTSDLAVFTPTTYQELERFAAIAAGSELVPKDYKGKPANVVVAVMFGNELGLHPNQALQSIAVINGRPSLWGDAVPALVQQHPKYEWMRETFDDATMTATCIVKRKGEDEHTVTFSQADAQRAGLWMKKGYQGGDTPWVTYPKRMLTLRARAFACRDKFADALKGISVAEEAMDIPADEPAKNVEAAAPSRTEQVLGKLMVSGGEAVITQQSRPDLDATTAPTTSTAGTLDTEPATRFQTKNLRELIKLYKLTEKSVIKRASDMFQRDVHDIDDLTVNELPTLCLDIAANAPKAKATV